MTRNRHRAPETTPGRLLALGGAVKAAPRKTAHWKHTATRLIIAAAFGLALYQQFANGN